MTHPWTGPGKAMGRRPGPGSGGQGRPAAHPPGKGRGEAAELAEVRDQLREAYETIEAIRGGAVDSLVIGPPGQEQVYALASADRPYRLIVEAMSEGAATISPRGIILEANPRLAAMTGRAAARLVGTPALDLAIRAHRGVFGRLLDVGAGNSARGEVEVTGPEGTTIPVQLAVSGFELDGMLLRCLVFTDLSAQRAAERRVAEAHEALREQNAFLEQAQETAGLGWWTWDLGRDGMLTCSPAAHRIFGLTPGRFDGKPETLTRLVHPDDAPGVSDAITSALEGGTFLNIEHRIVRPDGAVRWVLRSAAVERDSAGVARRLLGICQDITDRKRPEDEIRAAAAYNRSLIEASLDPLVTIGPEGAITDVNTATEQATGRGRAELIGTEFSDYFTEPARARAGYQQVYREGSVRDYALELRHRDGNAISVLYNASLYQDESGHALGVFAAARDVTQVRRAQEALRESEGRLRALFDNAPAGVDDISPGGEIVRVNPRFCEITGYTAGELRSMHIEDIVHPDDLAAYLDGTRRLLSGEISTHAMEKRYLTKDGGVVWTEANRAVVRDPGGAPLLIVGVVRDITAQRHAEAEVRQLNAELEGRVQRRTADLERANKNLEAFTYSVSHDLRAPLRALNGFSDALLEDCGDRLGETGRGYAGRIQAASERMGALIDDLLHLSRVSRAALTVEPLDLSALVEAVAAELRSRDPDRSVRFTIQERVRVIADRNLIRTVVQNLVENAWKFTAPRDTAAIEFGARPAGDARVCCFVRDNGVGFDPAYGGKLFQPFQRLHTFSEFPGTGVGLASVRQIVERHGGRVGAESKVGEGATFSFTLQAPGAPEARP